VPDHAYIDSTESVERQNKRLLKITEALILRVERDTDETGNAYSLFQRAIELEGEVQARTQDLQRTLDELNQVNEKLEAATTIADEANRAKTRFLAAASHDVLQPLNAAKLFLGSLEETDLNAHQARITGRLRTAFNSVEALLGALLDISKLDSAEATAEVSTISISQILDPIAIEFAPVAHEKGIGFSVVPSSMLIESDPSHLRRIAQNLVSNAVRYCNVGRVLVGCRKRGRHLRLEIHDTGPGMEPKEIPNIFREFHQLQPESIRSDQGMGLGLAIVDRACRLLGHPIEIKTTPGKGSTFMVSVPLAPNPENTERPANLGVQNEHESLEGMIVIALERTNERAESLVTPLERWGASVITVTSETNAIQACEQLGLPPDVILMCDPVLNAWKLAEQIERLRSIYQQITPVVVVGQKLPNQESTPLTRLTDVSFISPDQMHRLRALLTWKLFRATK